MDLQNLHGKCLFCGNPIPGYYNPAKKRFCCVGSTPWKPADKFGDDLELYPTVFPVPSKADGEFAPPHPASRPSMDAFAISIHDPALPPATAHPSLPYPASVPEMDQLHCGNAVLHGLGGHEENFGFSGGNITVCDLATYPWSNTLKDLRTWAVVRTAVQSRIRHLGVWTAGNAGLSLVKMVYAVNRVLKLDERIQVYCYSSNGSLPKSIQRLLESYQAYADPFPRDYTGPIFTPADAVARLNSRLGSNIQIDQYWDVTDGLDGVGLYMYRLLARQLCVHLRPRYIVVPVGTGDLFYGFYLGVQDCRAKDLIEATDCQIVAAIPEGESIVNNYEKYGIHIDVERDEFAPPSDTPCAPKLTTIYTPLLLVMYKAMIDPSVIRMVISRSEQEVAANELCCKNGPQLVAVEPSALIAFGALKRLSNVCLPNKPGTNKLLKRTRANEKVVVVNSGCGAMGDEEIKFLSANFARTR
jgi:hypothetical protein